MAADKKCSSCGQVKPLEAFKKRPERKSGRAATCKACHAAAERVRAAAARGPLAEPDAAPLATMRPWATDLEREALDALVAAGTVAGAAESLGMPPRRLRGLLSELERRSAARGWAPASDMVTPQPDGFSVKGVSSYYGADGELRGQWVKTRRDDEQRLAALMDAMQMLAEPFKGVADPVPTPTALEDDLLTVYPMGDPHIGLFSWHKETGEDFDLKIAERDLVAAVDHLVGLAPASREAIVVSLGDALHSDGKRNMTTSGTPVDVDTRWSKMFSVAVRAMRRCVERALEKHERVKVICVTGNHDEHLSLVLALCLAQFYEREPRVDVDTSPAKFFWHRFGKCLLGFHHGDACKREALPSVMACDRREDWGQTEYRAWYVGHVHHEIVKEYPGCTVESFRTLAPKDAWHAASGYRSMQDMKCDVWHREYGRIMRHAVGIKQVRSKL